MIRRHKVPHGAIPFSRDIRRAAFGLTLGEIGYRVKTVDGPILGCVLQRVRDASRGGEQEGNHKYGFALAHWGPIW